MLRLRARGDRRPRRTAARDRGLAHALGAQPRRDRARAAPRVLLAAAGLAAGPRPRGPDRRRAARSRALLGAALAQVPAAWVLAGVALALFGVAPARDRRRLGRARALPRAGRARPGRSSSPQALVDVSPFAHSPAAARAARSAPRRSSLTAVAAALGRRGLAGLRRRDLTS